MNEEIVLERLMPTRENLDDFLARFPDHRQRYEFAIQHLQPGMVIADIACGGGYGSWLMSGHCTHVCGVDISEEALSHARNVFSEPNIQFIHSDEFDYPARFDLIISFETIEHMDEAAGDIFLKRIKQNLKPDGTLIMSTPINTTPYKHNVTEFHVREYDDVEFPAKLCDNGFELAAMYGQRSDYHKKLFGAEGRMGIYDVMKLGAHKLLPRFVRNWLKSRLLGDPNEGLEIKQENWRKSAIQIAVCRHASPK